MSFKWQEAKSQTNDCTATARCALGAVPASKRRALAA
jgi:hypothetical protein